MKITLCISQVAVAAPTARTTFEFYVLGPNPDPATGAHPILYLPHGRPGHPGGNLATNDDLKAGTAAALAYLVEFGFDRDDITVYSGW